MWAVITHYEALPEFVPHMCRVEGPPSVSAPAPPPDQTWQRPPPSAAPSAASSVASGSSGAFGEGGRGVTGGGEVPGGARGGPAGPGPSSSGGGPPVRSRRLRLRQTAVATSLQWHLRSATSVEVEESAEVVHREGDEGGVTNYRRIVRFEVCTRPSSSLPSHSPLFCPPPSFIFRHVSLLIHLETRRHCAAPPSPAFRPFNP